MILTLILAADARDSSRAVSRLPAATFTTVWHTDDANTAPSNLRQWFEDYGSPESVHVIRTARWQYNEGVIYTLRLLATLTKLIDPTGLLGIETSGLTPELLAKRTITDSPPIGKLGDGSSQKSVPPRKTQPTRRYNG